MDSPLTRSAGSRTVVHAEDAVHPFGRLRRVGLAWLAVYLPSYTLAYGVTNFLFLCNLGVMVTAVALVAGSRLWLSSQAVAAPVIGLAWGLDAGARLLTGAHLFGGTEYMWDPQYPLFTRLLSLYHVAWPLLVLWCVRRAGYDRRGWPLQTAIAAAALLVSRLATSPEENVNFAFRDPFWGLQLGPAPLHLALVLAALAGLAYGATHALWTRVVPGASQSGAPASGARWPSWTSSPAASRNGTEIPSEKSQ